MYVYISYIFPKHIHARTNYLNAFQTVQRAKRAKTRRFNMCVYSDLRIYVYMHNWQFDDAHLSKFWPDTYINMHPHIYPYHTHMLNSLHYIPGRFVWNFPRHKFRTGTTVVIYIYTYILHIYIHKHIYISYTREAPLATYPVNLFENLLAKHFDQISDHVKITALACYVRVRCATLYVYV